VGAEEVAHPLAGLWLGREDGGQGRGLDLDCAARHGSIIRMIKDIIMRNYDAPEPLNCSESRFASLRVAVHRQLWP
jgi:hypothetical protein